MTEYPLIDVLISGGWVMVPLGICSLAALAVTIERFFWGPSATRVAPERLFQDVRQLVASGRYDEAQGACRASDTALGRILLVVLSNRGSNRDSLIETAQFAGKRESMLLQKRLAVLSVISAVSPLLGLLGTVSGMIRTFTAVSHEGIGNPLVLAGGISEALIATASGLTIAIPTLVLYRYFIHQAKAYSATLEEMVFPIIEEVTKQPAAGQRTVTLEDRTTRGNVRNI